MHLSAVSQDQTHLCQSWNLLFQPENPYWTLNTDIQCRDKQPPCSHNPVRILTLEAFPVAGQNQFAAGLCGWALLRKWFLRFFFIIFSISKIDIFWNGENVFYCFSSLSSATMSVVNCLHLLTASKMKFSIFARVPAHVIPSPVFCLLQVVYYFSTRQEKTKSEIISTICQHSVKLKQRTLLLFQ